MLEIRKLEVKGIIGVPLTAQTTMISTLSCSFVKLACQVLFSEPVGSVTDQGGLRAGNWVWPPEVGQVQFQLGSKICASGHAEPNPLAARK